MIIYCKFTFLPVQVPCCYSKQACGTDNTFSNKLDNETRVPVWGCNLQSKYAKQPKQQACESTAQFYKKNKKIVRKKRLQCCYNKVEKPVRGFV